MEVKECYSRLHGNYEEAKQRLMNDKLIDRFLLMFPKDDSMALLRNAVANKDIKESFRGAHTLKGVAANLAFTELQEAASNLTEQLRSCTAPADPVLVQKVEACYSRVMDSIKLYQAEK